MPRPRRTVWLMTTAVVLAAAGSGCAPLLIGSAVAAGGVAGYAYYAAEQAREYDAGASEVRLATRNVLTEMGMPVVEEHSDTNGGWLVSRTPAGQRLSVTFSDNPEPNSPSGFVTRVGVRVAAFGDQEFSRNFLDQLGGRLYGVSPPPPPGAAPGAPPGTAVGRLTPQPQPRPGESPPPPLADAKSPPKPGQPAPVQPASWQAPSPR